MNLKTAIVVGIVLSTITAPAFADPTNADVVGGALTAGKVAVPWAVFHTKSTSKNIQHIKPKLYERYKRFR